MSELRFTHFCIIDIMKNLRYLIPAIIVILSCSKQEEPQNDVLLPTDLQVSIDTASAIDGFVEVSASAQKSNFYSVEFFYPGGSEYIETTDGNASYIYQDSGTFSIRVKAHATANQFIQKDTSVTVSVSSNIGDIPNRGYTTPLSYPGYTLVWQDEFNGTTLSSDWTHEIGTGNNGWGNNELQYYKAENTEVKDGYLVITAKREPFNGQQYTSSRIITSGKQSFKYGRIDIRAVLPQGKGMWPALWMLGDSFWNQGWPNCGEIDIMEMVGGDRPTEGDDFVHGTIHWDNNNQYAKTGGSNQLSNGIFADEFHVFSIIWDDTEIRWYRDDIKYYEVDITSSAMSEFHQNFFFIFNVAVGGNWPGSPNATTQFPQFMAVDYVRVFQK